MFSNLQIRPARSHRRKPSLSIRAGVTKRRVSTVTAAAASNVPSLSFMEELFGKEFPEAFATNVGGIRANQKTLLDLPVELLSLTCDYLSGLDIKRLRLACQHLAKHVRLRIDRVYLSPNKANLDCLQWVLRHPWYSKCVREIVWDDAQLEEYPTLETFHRAILVDQSQWATEIERRLERFIQGHGNGSVDCDVLDRDDLFSLDGRLNDVAKDILLQYDDRFSRAVLARSAFMMSVQDSYVLYTELYREEQDLIKQRADVAALELALKQLHGLRKITLTSEVWRPWNYYPSRYDSPYHRSLPAGFRKPTVWPWLDKRPLETEAMHERRLGILLPPFTGSLPNAWRGYTILTSALLSQRCYSIDEFIVDTGRERAGLNRNLFTQPNQDLEQTIQLFHETPLKKLQLVLHNARCSDIPSEPPLAPPITSQLKRLLGELYFLAHLDLQLDGDDAQCFYWDRVFPPWLAKQLSTLSLRSMAITEPSLIRLVKCMKYADRITLDRVTLVHDQDQDQTQCVEPSHPQHFFSTLRDYYAEPARPAIVPPPLFTWIEDLEPRQYFFHRCRRVHEEINDFLYGGWDCPFHGHRVRENVGWVIDTRDPDFKLRMAEYTQQNGGMALDEWT